MNKEIHRSDSRGLADHGWLFSRHTFSFANYYDSNRMGFGKLRVLNDDIVHSSKGFGTHPHDNMEIVSIPLSGTLRHEDNMGNKHIIRSGEIQVMSAGTGITHSEYNDSSTEEVNFLQIWVLPKKKNIEPRYAQKDIDTTIAPNEFAEIVAPYQENSDVAWINQDAYFSLANLTQGTSTTYKSKLDTPAIYLFVISGEVVVDGDILNERDGMALDDLAEVEITANQTATVLCIETTL